MNTFEQSLRNDALWLALERAIRRVQEEKQILWQRKPDWNDGLNCDEINQLAHEANISNRPVYEIPPPLVKSDHEIARYLNIHHPNFDDPVKLCIWNRYGTQPISDTAVSRLLEHLRAWQERRVKQIVDLIDPHKLRTASNTGNKTPAEQKNISFGIITALPKEFIAVKSILKDPELITLRGGGTTHCVVIGRVESVFGGEHLVALTMADMGNNMAAVTTTTLLHQFPSITHIFMVGIAGGVPSPTKPEDHVRLGDIVVSNKKGVIQYDMVKLEEIRGYPIAPSAKLLDAVRRLQADEEQGKRPWEERIKLGLKEINIKRPPANTDKLYDAEKPGVPIKHPKDVGRRKNLPRVFLGPIASANELLKNPIKRDLLREKFGVKAVEMEGSGTADAAWSSEKEYIVVRGICDYCDTHKNDTWQKYAAVCAAAYAITLIASLPTNMDEPHDSSNPNKPSVEPNVIVNANEKNSVAIGVMNNWIINLIRRKTTNPNNNGTPPRDRVESRGDSHQNLGIANNSFNLSSTTINNNFPYSLFALTVIAILTVCGIFAYYNKAPKLQESELYSFDPPIYETTPLPLGRALRIRVESNLNVETWSKPKFGYLLEVGPKGAVYVGTAQGTENLYADTIDKRLSISIQNEINSFFPQ